MNLATSRRFDPYIAGALASLLYLATRSRNHTYDALSFALKAEGAELSEVVETHQIMTTVIAWVSYRLPLALGWAGRAIDSLQIVNALAGGICVGLVFATAAMLTGSRRLSALVATGFAVSGATWLLATDAEFVTVPLAFGAAALLMALRAARSGGSTGAAIAAGVMVGFATLASLPNAAAALSFAAAVALGHRTGENHLRRIGVLTFAVLATALPPYAVIAGSDIIVPHMGMAWYGRFAPRDVAHGAYGFVRSFVLAPGLSMGDHTSYFFSTVGPMERLGFVLRYAAASVVVAPLAALFTELRRRGSLGDAPMLGAIGIWSGAHALFAIWWVPGDVTFWLPVVYGWWLMVAIVARTMRLTESRKKAVALGALVCLLALVNATAVILPNRDGALNIPRAVALELITKTSPGDLVLSSRDPGISMYLTLLGPRNTFFADAYLLAPPSVRPDAEAMMLGEIESVEERGSAVWLVGFAPSGLDRWQTLQEPVWTPADRARFRLEQVDGIDGVPAATIWRRTAD